MTLLFLCLSPLTRIFNVNVYCEFKIVYVITFLSPGKFICMGQSLHAGAQVCFYKSHLLRRKWLTPLSGQVLCVRLDIKLVSNE